MCPKKTKGSVQKPSPASRTGNQSRNSERQTKKNTTIKTTKTTSRNIKHSTAVHKRKNKPQAVKKKSTESIKKVTNAKDKLLKNQKIKLDQKKKKTKITTKSNVKQPRLLHKKNNLKNLSSTKKTGSKLRKSKKSTPELFIDGSKKNGERTVTEISTSIPSSTPTGAETNENRFVSEITETSVNPFMLSSSVARKADTLQLVRSHIVDTCVSRGILQSNKSSLERSHTANAGLSREALQLSKQRMERSHITDTDFSRRALQSSNSFLVPGVRVITPSTAVSPASVIHDEPSVIRNLKPTGFNRNLEPSEILDMAEVHNNLYFLMKWKGSPAIDLIPVKIANERCPQLVIQFYESRLKNVFRSSN